MLQRTNDMAALCVLQVIPTTTGTGGGGGGGGSTAAAAAVESAANAFVAKPTSALSSSLGVSVHHMHAH